MAVKWTKEKRAAFRRKMMAAQRAKRRGRRRNPRAKLYRLSWTTFHEGAQYKDGTLKQLRPAIARLVRNGTPYNLTNEKGVRVRRANPGRRRHSKKFDRCVRKVKRSGSAVNAYAVCEVATARGRRSNPVLRQYGVQVADKRSHVARVLGATRSRTYSTATMAAARKHANRVARTLERRSPGRYRVAVIKFNAA